MTETSDEPRGMTKSAPKEITKLPRHTCERCGLEAPAPIVSADYRCANLAACERRRRQRPQQRKSEAT